MKVPVHAFWYISQNFGDELNYFILRRLSGQDPVYVDLSEKTTKLIAIGSILNHADEWCTVWGAGIANRTDIISPLATIAATRGPISYQRSIECGAKPLPVWGDPALLLPYLVTPREIKKRYRVSIIPHYVDSFAVHQKFRSDSVHIIDILGGIRRVIDEIVASDVVVSSSLHGLIVANAYGVPAHWAKFSDKVIGDGTKFIDHFKAIRTDHPDQPVDFSLATTDDIVRTIAGARPIVMGEFNPEPLLEACPFEIQGDPLRNRPEPLERALDDANCHSLDESLPVGDRSTLEKTGQRLTPGLAFSIAQQTAHAQCAALVRSVSDELHLQQSSLQTISEAIAPIQATLAGLVDAVDALRAEVAQSHRVLQERPKTPEPQSLLRRMFKNRRGDI